jgi:putative N6-adenine-specific DNA methylase
LGVGYCRARRGGVEFRASTRQLYSANVWLRTATRVITRVSHFRARSFAEVEAGAAATPWFDFASPERAVRFAVTSHRSRLYHTDAIAERFARVFGRPLGDDSDDAQLFVIRFDRDNCTVSADTSGRPLHQRGWRLATAKAPLRPTLAAAMLLSCGWPDAPRSASRSAGGRSGPASRSAGGRSGPASRSAGALLDPLCGSGTIAIEAALIALQRAPGAGREFSFQQWPSFEPGTWASVRATLRATRDDPPSSRAEGRAGPAWTIIACDRDAGAIEATMANAERAGVAEHLQLHVTALSSTGHLDAVQAAPPGLVITNPPYGVRVSSSKGLRDLYASLGNLMRGPLAPWDLAFLAADDTLARATGLALSPVLRSKNGGIDVTLWLRRSNETPALADDGVGLLDNVDEAHLTALREQDT